MSKFDLVLKFVWLIVVLMYAIAVCLAPEGTSLRTDITYIFIILAFIFGSFDIYREYKSKRKE